MGMAICPRNPSPDCPESFSASIWTWHAIHDLTSRLCRDLLGDELLKAMETSDGRGPDTPQTCQQMAERFRAWMADHPGDTKPN